MKSDVDKLIRLLIVDEGLHKAEQITSSLRATGLHVRAEFAEDGEDMCAILENKTLDLVLFSMDLPEFTLKQAQHLISECGRHVALIAMTNQPSTDVIVQSINDGAQDVVSSKSLDHLIQVIKRESYCLDQWRKSRRLELQLQESEKRCQTLLANSKDAVAYVHEGMHIYANEVYIELFGNADFDELEGVPIIDMVDSSQRSELKSFLRQLSQGDVDKNYLDLSLIHSSGESIQAKMEFSRASYDGEPCTQILIRSPADTSELEEQINYLHQHDLITSLYNHHYFIDELKESLAKATNALHQYSMIMVVIDNFQAIRDRVGISGCDVLIGDVAMILKSHAFPDQIVARFGAHSYSFLSVIKDKAVVEKQASQIPALIGNHISEIGEQSIGATCSVSVVFIDENSPNNTNEIIARAEKTCDELQQVGGNQFGIYIPKEGERTQEEEDGLIASEIKDALANNRVQGFYQPIVSIKTQPGARYISSLVIIDREGNRLSGQNFITAAQRTGTSKALDRWSIMHAIKKINDARKKNRTIEIIVPISVVSLFDTSLVTWLTDCIVQASINAEQLGFMVNEGDAVNQLKATKTLFKVLKQMNCKFALDEFGTGINPYQLVKHIKADYVRINAAYMENLAQNSENQGSIREIATQLQELDIHSITPCVDDAAILSVLWTLNVDFVQGDFLQPPDRVLQYDFSSM
ncbi:MAG: EAL domain-containing protein [Gammaproteobacteria bacterium]|nr:EAL domain-containing protein [Gammaproteobacteria bacterium]